MRLWELFWLLNLFVFIVMLLILVLHFCLFGFFKGCKPPWYCFGWQYIKDYKKINKWSEHLVNTIRISFNVRQLEAPKCLYSTMKASEQQLSQTKQSTLKNSNLSPEAEGLSKMATNAWSQLRDNSAPRTKWYWFYPRDFTLYLPNLWPQDHSAQSDS